MADGNPAPESPALTRADLAEQADLRTLATGLAQRGYPATLLTVLPVLAVSHLGSLPPPRILAAGCCYYGATAKRIGARTDTGQAADIITWTLRARPRP